MESKELEGTLKTQNVPPITKVLQVWKRPEEHQIHRLVSEFKLKLIPEKGTEMPTWPKNLPRLKFQYLESLLKSFVCNWEGKKKWMQNTKDQFLTPNIYFELFSKSPFFCAFIFG